ncbi:I78 family peptidase inhibitor [Sphingomonas sp.]|uniref:I78 family peptidase inhibitor n=1 Tax=Sphingomonas sp. TaxID=28214 RepID=UPI003CC68CB4
MMLAVMLMLAQSATPIDRDDAVPGMCAAAAAEVLVGEHYRRHVPTRARQLSGARTVRVIWPGQMVTQDFREDRLNLRIDHRRTITAVSCG